MARSISNCLPKVLLGVGSSPVLVKFKKILGISIERMTAIANQFVDGDRLVLAFDANAIEFAHPNVVATEFISVFAQDNVAAVFFGDAF